MLGLTVLFVEGETERLFYDRVIKILSNANDLSKSSPFILIKNLKGISTYTKKIPRIITNIQHDYPCVTIKVIISHDTDVFELSSSPPVDWKDVEKEIKKLGINTIEYIHTSASIEDWFLIDTKGVLKFLRLPQNTKITGQNGLQKLQNLFKRGNKVYAKGSGASSFIDALDIPLIISKVCNDIQPLCSNFRMRCKSDGRCYTKLTSQKNDRASEKTKRKN